MSKTIDERLEAIETQQLSANNMLIEIQKQNTVTQTSLKKLLELLEEETEEVDVSTMDVLDEIVMKLEVLVNNVGLIIKKI